MLFLLRRYLYTLSRNRRWLPLVVVPALVYILLAARNITGYTITQSVYVPTDAPLALAADPMGTSPLSDYLKHPDRFLLDTAALRELHLHLRADRPAAAADEAAFTALHETVDRTMAMTAAGEGMVEFAYSGQDRGIGETLVKFYADRLVAKARAGYGRRQFQIVEKVEEGVGRTRFKFARDPEAGARTDAIIQTIRRASDTGFEEHRAWWTPTRLPVTTALLAAAVLAYLLWVALLEALDPAIKSERNAARYLGLPVLGSIPNLDRLAARLKK